MIFFVIYTLYYVDQTNGLEVRYGGIFERMKLK
jgi:hypothetical protein